ncbi:MAG: M48 family metallopeptidase [Candidatus Pacebacteria bacterium]|nr:M48 family metallopeptidase [Candidatus Paceibacterota bacterium]
MNRELNIKGKKYNYKLVRRSNCRSLRLRVYQSGEISVSAPIWGLSLKRIEKFVSSAILNIDPKVLARQKKLPEQRQNYLQLKEKARKLILSRLEIYSQKLGLEYRQVSIRNQKTRWGSCSKEGNLNFNYRLYNLPPRLLDYVIVHELCHLKEFNHSKKFWQLVASIFSDYKQLKKDLKEKYNLS